MQPLELEFAIREDPWGMLGSESIIGKLLLSPSHPMRTKKLGEAWCGTHRVRPALIKGKNQNLLEFISSHPTAILGGDLLAQYGNELPFLFKILTIAVPLSIQVHPNIKKAIELSDKFPDRYKDKNEKPEIGIAVTETKLFFGFKELSKIVERISELEPAKKFFKNELLSPTIKSLYQRLVRATELEIAKLNQETAEVLQGTAGQTNEDQEFIKLFTLYPNDKGPFQVFFLNLVTLNPGQGIFISPDTLHAYLSGQLIECMATSDFVIRAGLTTKETDSESLLDTINYSSSIINKITPANLSGEFSKYLTPVKQFQIEKAVGRSTIRYEGPVSPVIYFCLRGRVEITAGGYTINLQPGGLCLVAAEDNDHQIECDGEVYRIFANPAT